MFRKARLALVFICLMALPSTASAGTTLGPDLTTPPGPGFVAVGCQAAYPSCTYVTLHSTSPTVLAAAPSPGIITSWSFRAGMNPDPAAAHTMTLGTFRPGTQEGAYPGLSFVVPVRTGTSFVIPAGNSLPSDPPTTLPARLPIAAGERVGILADQPISFAVYNPIAGATSTVLFTGFPPFNGEDYGSAISSTAMAISARVEPDADGDQYGDETQDCFPADPTRWGCNQPPVQPPFQPPPIVDPGGKCEVACGGGIIFTPPPPPPQGGDGSKFYVALRCPTGATAPCGGFVIVSTLSPGKPRSRGSIARPPAATVFKQLAKKGYTVPAGKEKKVVLKLSKPGRKLLARKGKLKVAVTVQPNSGDAFSTTRTLKAR